ncbi:MAG: hypothetical protein RBT63_03500 [Bdellovibrionales bacterium]|jgi:diaminopimelate decarboxylase|nr:hypothetical protein [Bdellovibrionales bacterium]
MSPCAIAFTAQQSNQTDSRPFFLYDLDRLRQDISRLEHFTQTWLPEHQASLHYSLKTNPNPHIVETILGSGWGLDVSSEEEFDWALRNINRFDSHGEIQISGIDKSNRLIEKAVLSNTTLNLDSIEEWNAARAVSRTPKNLQPRIRLDTPLFLKHGMSLEMIRSHALKSELRGLHLYWGRERFHAQEINRALIEINQWVATNRDIFKHDQGFDGIHLSIGPGLPGSKVEPIPLRKGELSEVKSIHLEIGRAAVTRCGSYSAKILAVKKMGAHISVIVNGGLQHLGSPVQSIFSQSANSVVEFHRPNVGLLAPDDRCTANIFGSLCLSHDLLLSHSSIPTDLKRGDWVLFHNTGAYGLTAAVPFFIGQDLPREHSFAIKPTSAPSSQSGHEAPPAFSYRTYDALKAPGP